MDCYNVLEQGGTGISHAMALAVFELGSPLCLVWARFGSVGTEHRLINIDDYCLISGIP